MPVTARCSGCSHQLQLGVWIILTVAIRSAALLSIGTTYGSHDFYCPVPVALSTWCVFEQHVARLCTCASKRPLRLLLCVMCFVQTCASCRDLLERVLCLFVLTKLPSNIFHSGSCSEERVTVCRITCSRGKKSLKIFKHPLLPLLHFCILNLTPTNVI